jgi:hypothetical protein
MRSVMHSLREEDLADLHLVTGDLPAGEMRIGQMPTWLDRNKSCSTHLQVHHHWDIFKMRDQNVLEPEAKVWREGILPTFNSIAIESQLVTLAPQLTDTALYVCVVSPFYSFLKICLFLSFIVQRRFLPYSASCSQRLLLAAFWSRFPHAKSRSHIFVAQRNFEGRSGRGVALAGIRKLAP